MSPDKTSIFKYGIRWKNHWKKMQRSHVDGKLKSDTKPGFYDLMKSWMDAWNRRENWTTTEDVDDLDYMVWWQSIMIYFFDPGYITVFVWEELGTMQHE
jgi:hypothetical protein